MSLLICGETGTGKEHLANALHSVSSRAGKPFVAVNCGALPESLIESELFGYEAGAFTGAKAKGKKGLILEADGGTLFLDEIGDMPVSSQTRLLRVLAEREVTPIGRTKPVPVNLRVIAATHRDLVEQVKAGHFREDLYFRLNGAVLNLPALRQRADLEWLIERLLARISAERGVSYSLSPTALDAFRGYAWPGNIRELSNSVDYACAISSDGVIEIDDLPECIARARRGDGWPQTEHPTPAPADAAAGLLAALRANHWNVSRVARERGVDRTTIHRQMRRFKLTAPNKLD